MRKICAHFHKVSVVCFPLVVVVGIVLVVMRSSFIPLWHSPLVVVMRSSVHTVEQAVAAVSAKSFVDGATGQLFKGEIVRQFPAARKLFSVGHTYPASDDVIGSRICQDDVDERCHCKKWSVFTTINSITESIERTLGLGDNWCTVAVLDKKTHMPFLTADGRRYGRKTCGDVKQLHILGVTQQSKMAEKVGFISDVPYNHFGRKNIGFFYAILNGAEMILDIDDDNELILERGDGLGFKLPRQDHDVNVEGLSEAARTISGLFNPYPMMGASNPAAWPRGLPLNLVTDAATYNPGLATSRIPWKRIGVIQSCANQDPDVDAIYRLTQRQRQFNFEPERETIAVPAGTLSPYNAQATLHLPLAYWGLILPITVPGRVSDIWRGYIVQRLFWDIGVQLAFTAPFVRQVRSPHSYLKDMDAERDLYFKATTLTGFLAKWTSRLPTLPGRIEQLMIELYERDYLGLGDVIAYQKWLEALGQIGYKFPVPTTSAIPPSDPDQNKTQEHEQSI